MVSGWIGLIGALVTQSAGEEGKSGLETVFCLWELEITGVSGQTWRAGHVTPILVQVSLEWETFGSAG